SIVLNSRSRGGRAHISERSLNRIRNRARTIGIITARVIIHALVSEPSRFDPPLPSGQNPKTSLPAGALTRGPGPSTIRTHQIHPRQDPACGQSLTPDHLLQNSRSHYGMNTHAGAYPAA